MITFPSYDLSLFGAPYKATRPSRHGQYLKQTYAAETSLELTYLNPTCSYNFGDVRTVASRVYCDYFVFNLTKLVWYFSLCALFLVIVLSLTFSFLPNTVKLYYLEKNKLRSCFITLLSLWTFFSLCNVVWYTAITDVENISKYRYINDILS